MKRSFLRLLSILVLAGCAESGIETEIVNDNSPVANGPAPDTSAEVTSVDAERLLASTLESAKADDKRVIVHLGAPW